MRCTTVSLCTRVWVALLQVQAEAVKLPLWTMPIPSPRSNQQYEIAMETAKSTRRW
jgi:hypothetical protein